MEYKISFGSKECEFQKGWSPNQFAMQGIAVPTNFELTINFGLTKSQIISGQNDFR